MRRFDVYSHPVRGYQVVKRGFSWPGFLIGPIWAFARRLPAHGTALLLLHWVAIASAVAGRNVVSALFLLASWGSPLVIGLMGNGWRRDRLPKLGYTVVGTVEARSADDAIAKVIRSAPAGVRTSGVATSTTDGGARCDAERDRHTADDSAPPRGEDGELPKHRDDSVDKEAAAPGTATRRGDPEEGSQHGGPKARARTPDSPASEEAESELNNGELGTVVCVMGIVLLVGMIAAAAHDLQASAVVAPEDEVESNVSEGTADTRPSIPDAVDGNQVRAGDAIRQSVPLAALVTASDEPPRAGEQARAKADQALVREQRISACKEMIQEYDKVMHLAESHDELDRARESVERCLRRNPNDACFELWHLLEEAVGRNGKATRNERSRLRIAAFEDACVGH